jgi:hypothetical protein
MADAAAARRVRLLLIAAGALLLAEALNHLLPGRTPPVSDFDVFHLAGRLVWRGQLALAYDYGEFGRLQTLLRGRADNLTFGYPPPYGLVVAPLGLLPLGAAWLLFMATTLAAWLWCLVRLAGDRAATALMVALAPLYINLVAGQNGFLTGALLGLACVGLLRGHAWAGVPLGLMVIKPQLALGLGLYVLASRNWRVAAVAVATAAAACGLATLVLGVGMWPAFLAGVGEQGAMMARGLYRFYRMQTPFAIAMSLHLPKGAALAVQAGAALAAAGLVIAAVRRCQPATAIGLAVLAGPCFSPYGYDYDLPQLVVGLALLAGPASMLPAWMARGALLCLPASALWSLACLLALPATAGPGQWPVAVGALASLACLALLGPALVQRGA